MRAAMGYSGAVVAVASLLAVAGVIAPATAAPSAYDDASGQTCLLAGNAVRAPGLTTDAGSTAAWTSLASTLQGLAAGTADAPLVRALDGVASSATGMASAIQAGSSTDAGLVSYNASVTTLWGACAQLVVSRQKLTTIKKFKRFAYDMGQVVGPPAMAAKSASLAVSSMVLKAVAQARKANRGSCPGGAKACGYFVQTLAQDPCIDGLICVRQEWGLLAVGANSSLAVVDTLALDASTGTPIPLAQVVPAAVQKQFLASADAAVAARLKAEGLGNDPFWKARLTMKEITAWLPEPDGIHIWFDKYAVAPGYVGVVSIVVPDTALSQ